MKALWDRYWYGPVALARPYLLARGIFLILAFDAWLVMTEHGGRYGVGDFNVAHFAWLDAVQPLPTQGLYVGMLLLVGLLAFGLAVGPPSRIGTGVLAVFYTWSWSMSQLDSYQHHYLLSLLLFAMAFFPERTANDVFGRLGGPPPAAPEPAKEGKKGKKDKGKSRSARKAAAVDPSITATMGTAWAYVLFGVSCALVYGWTAITKMEQDWREGHALRRLLSDQLPEPFDTWDGMAQSAILVQLVIFAGFLVAAVQDSFKRLLPKIAIALVLLAPLSFHLGAEKMELKIGWFSWYMTFISLVFFAPTTAVHWTGWAISYPVRQIAVSFSDAKPSESDRIVTIVLGLFLAGVIPLFGYHVDLPGGLGAGIAAAVALAAAVGVALYRGSLTGARHWMLAGAAAAAMMWASISGSEVRFDYYRYVGGDMRRRGELERSLQAYVKANRYAPSDCEALHDRSLSRERRRCDRRREEQEVRQMLGR